MLIAIGRRAKSEGLVDLLLECHGRIRNFVQLAKHVGQRRDVTASEVVDACRACERYFIEALPLHVADEELSVLPRLRGLSPDVDDALATMHTQHREHEPLLCALLERLRAVREAPDEAELRARLAFVANALEEELGRHLKLEEEHLFPIIRRDMPEETQARVIDELRARRQPSTSPGR